MPDLVLTLTDVQWRELRRLDPAKTVKQIVQVHMDTWLAPLVASHEQLARARVADAFAAADADTRAKVCDTLKVDTDAVRR